jgi:ubiquinone/menaquinone biosynthesis C-methylase UbiE
MGDWESIFKAKGKYFYEPEEEVKKIIPLLKKSSKVLDLGCGTGRHTIEMAKNKMKVYAMDISKSGLELTKKWLKEQALKAHIINASCYEHFPFEDTTFDAVISTQVIHHNYHEKILFI